MTKRIKQAAKDKVQTNVKIGVTTITSWVLTVLVPIISAIVVSIERGEFSGPNKWAAIGAAVIYIVSAIFRYLQSILGEAAAVPSFTAQGRMRLGLPEVREAVTEDPSIIQQLKSEGVI